MPYIPTVLTTIFVWFVSSEFICFWLFAGNRYPQCEGVRDVGVLDEDGELTVGGRGKLYKMCEKGGEAKMFKREAYWVKLWAWHHWGS